jgi:excisionase family DNA binding protein
VLGICTHALPCTHSDVCLPLGSSIGRTGRGRNWEPLTYWGPLIASARTILGVTQAIRGGADPDADQVRELAGYAKDLRLPGEEPRDLVSEIMTWWLKTAGAVMAVVWDEDQPGLILRFRLSREDDPRLAGVIFDYLALQLAAAASTVDENYICNICRRLFSTEGRRPRTDRAVYCEDCKVEGRRASKRRWWRDNRRHLTSEARADGTFEARTDSSVSMEDRTLTTREVADYLRVSIKRVSRHLNSGQLRGIRLGGRAGWRIRQSDLKQFLEALRYRPPPSS